MTDKPQVYIAPVGTPLPTDGNTEGWTKLGEARSIDDVPTHDRWVGIDWAKDSNGSYFILSHETTQCTCVTPWRHYP